MNDDLIARLRGEYRIPITDGLGSAGGEEPDNAHEFVRRFDTPPIQKEAADALEAQAARIAERDSAGEALQAVIRRFEAERASADTLASALAEAVTLLTDVRHNGLIYWEPQSQKGAERKALMSARIDAFLAKLKEGGITSASSSPASGVRYATVRDGGDNWHIECRFEDGQKFAPITVDGDQEALAHFVAAALSSSLPAGVDAVARIAAFLKERDECVLSDEVDDAERKASAEEIMRLVFASSPATTESEQITARYTNWRGETAERTIIPRRVFFGSNEWHPEPQVLIEALDCDKGVVRTFAAAGFAQPVTAIQNAAYERAAEAVEAIYQYVPDANAANAEYRNGHTHGWRAMRQEALAAIRALTEGGERG